MKRLTLNKLLLAALVVGVGMNVSAMLGTATAAEGDDANKVVCEGSTTVGPVAKAFAAYYMETNPGVNVTVSESGSGNGAKALINSTCDVADMSRFMKDTEFKAAIEKGVMPVAHVVAMDGIAMIVHPANPIKAVTTEQIRDIYLGKISKWSQLGGPEADIVVISRDTNSGTYETFEEKIMEKQKMAQSVEYVGSNGAAKERVTKTPAAIAFVGLGFAGGSDIKALPVNGVAPTKATVASGKYPIARPLFMFTNGYPRLGSHLHAFITLYLTKKGQEIIEETGFVPVTNYQ